MISEGTGPVGMLSARVPARTAADRGWRQRDGMTGGRIRAAAKVVLDVDSIDIAAPLAELLERLADVIDDLTRIGGPAEPALIARMPEYRALFALVAQIEEAHT